jgi:oligopeptidase B
MPFSRLVGCIALALLVGACAEQTSPSADSARATAATTAASPLAPIAEQREHVVTAPHGAARNDEYYWLRDDTRENPEMLAYLNAENAYTDAVMAPLAPLQARLYDELVSRVQQDDSSVPYRERGYWYYTRFEEGQDYPIHARRKGSMEAPEEILLDLNALAEGHGYYDVGNRQVSADNRLLAYAEDTVGRRQYSVRFKDLDSGELLPDVIGPTSGSMVWAADSKTVFFIENDPVTLLSKRVLRHTLGSDAPPAVVYEEADDSFYMGVMNTRSEQYVCIGLRSTVSSEMRCADAADPQEFRVFAPRERDFEYQADHLDGRWVVRTNWNAANFKLMAVDDTAAFGGRDGWRDLLPHDEKVLIGEFELFDGFTAVGERSGGLQRIRLAPAAGEHSYVAADEPAYSMALSINSEADTDWLRYSYTSLTTPASTFELNVKTGERRLLKEQPVPGDFDKANYTTERLWVPARDGTLVPVSLVYRNGYAKDGSAAILIGGYGSYGASRDPGFSSNLISLLDRGMVYAIAHVRGGQEMGRHWYEDGKLFNKMNTFTDFVDVTRHLVQERYAAPNRVAAQGGSAGGLLMGAIANQAPEDYRVLISLVPFVDVVTTMLDESIPLTTNEFDEWGNPAQADYYEYMLSYSPYDQIEAKAYPAMYIGTGLWDSQVQYWEPAKYVARLRARKTDNNPVVFRTEMQAGHGGRSGRFQRYQEAAEQYAFMLQQLGIAE